MEIPADQCALAARDEELRALMRRRSISAAGANVQHGKGNGNADYHNIIKKLMEFGDTYMANTFIPDIEKIAIAIGAAKTAVGRGYNNYPKDKPEETLSFICKAKRDAAILNQHKKGLSDHAIAKLFGMTQSTVTRTRNELMQNPDSGKCITQSSPSYLPQANTEDRSDIRQDSSALDGMIDNCFGDEDEEFVPFTLSEDEDDEPPFDVLAVTGFGEDLARYNVKPKKTLAYEDMTPVQLQEAYLDALDVVASIKKAAALKDISLPA